MVGRRREVGLVWIITEGEEGEKIIRMAMVLG